MSVICLQGEVQTIDTEICQSIKQLQVKGKELASARRVENNMKTTIELLQQCLPVIRAYIKLQQQMKEKRYTVIASYLSKFVIITYLSL